VSGRYNGDGRGASFRYGNGPPLPVEWLNEYEARVEIAHIEENPPKPDYCGDHMQVWARLTALRDHLARLEADSDNTTATMTRAEAITAVHEALEKMKAGFGGEIPHFVVYDDPERHYIEVACRNGPPGMERIFFSYTEEGS